ncbi:hypothetical protein ZA09F29_01860 [Escherichia coli]
MYKRKHVYELRPNQMSHGRPWDASDIASVRKMAGSIHSKHIARKINRSYESLRQMCKREGISLRLVSDKACSMSAKLTDRDYIGRFGHVRND